MHGCTQKSGTGDYVARVGSSQLTEKEMQLAEGKQPLSRQYVSEWVTTELLYQEALRKGFAESEVVRQQLEDARKQFVINAFLEKTLYGDSAAVSDEELQAEFEKNAEGYKLREDVAQLSFAIFSERDAATAFRSRILRGGPWDEAVADKATAAQLIRVATRAYFTQSALYPEELWKIARTLSKESLSFVVKTNVGYCVALVHSTKRQGETPEFGYVRGELRERVLMERRRQHYDSLVAALRAATTVDVRLDAVDTTGE